MDTSLRTDTLLANVAGGITLGLAIWTISTAIIRTKACKAPLRSLFIWMIWGDILINIGMAVHSLLQVDN
jgi:hypothetical protein